MLQFTWQGKTYNLETLSSDDYDSLNQAIQSPATKQELIASLKKMIAEYCPTMQSGYTSLHKAIFNLLARRDSNSFHMNYPYMYSTAYKSNLAPNALWKTIVELSVDEMDGKRLATVYQNKGVEGLGAFLFNEHSIGMLYLYALAINTHVNQRGLVELIQAKSYSNPLHFLYYWKGQRELTFVNTAFINTIAGDKGVLTVIDRGTAKEIAENILWPIICSHLPQVTTQRLSEDFNKATENAEMSTRFTLSVVDFFTEKLIVQNKNYLLAKDNMSNTLHRLIKKLGTRLTKLSPSIDIPTLQPNQALALTLMISHMNLLESTPEINRLKEAAIIYTKAYAILKKIHSEASNGSEKLSNLVPILEQMNKLFQDPSANLEQFKIFAKKTMDSPSPVLETLGALMLGLAIGLICIPGAPIGVVGATALAITGLGVLGYGLGRQRRDYSELLTDLAEPPFEACKDPELTYQLQIT